MLEGWWEAGPLLADPQSKSGGGGSADEAEASADEGHGAESKAETHTEAQPQGVVEEAQVKAAVKSNPKRVSRFGLGGGGFLSDASSFLKSVVDVQPSPLPLVTSSCTSTTHWSLAYPTHFRASRLPSNVPLARTWGGRWKVLWMRWKAQLRTWAAPWRMC